MPTKTTDLVGYQYKADLYCERCILRACSSVGEVAAAISEGLDNGPDDKPYVDEVLSVIAMFRGVDRDNEDSFDSSEYPKVLLREHARTELLAPESSLDHLCGHCGCVLVEQPAIEPYVTIAEYFSRGDQ